MGAGASNKVKATTALTGIVPGRRSSASEADSKTQPRPVAVELRWRDAAGALQAHSIDNAMLPTDVTAAAAASVADEVEQVDAEAAAEESHAQPEPKNEVQGAPTSVCCGFRIHELAADKVALSSSLKLPPGAQQIAVHAVGPAAGRRLQRQLLQLFGGMAQRLLRQQWIAAVGAGNLDTLQRLLDDAVEVPGLGSATKEGPAEAAGHSATTVPGGVRSRMLDWRSSDGRPALLMAVDDGNVELCRWLIEAAADVNVEHAGGTALDRAVALGTPIGDAIGQLLLQSGAEMSGRSSRRLSSAVDVCFRAVTTGKEWMLDAALSGSSFRDRPQDCLRLPWKWSLLHQAVIDRHANILAWLTLRAPELLSTADAYGRRPLFYAAQEGYMELLPQLSSEQALDLADTSGRTPLWSAAKGGRAPRPCRLLPLAARASLRPAAA
eukprot:TRINITY_DN28282_c1_g1_i1.p1 TRINITY_DN28282_c1_g1~~TRINITY_DN28282_c1_g1_i1.p1  ORF type:complete len:438 (+),score=91.70 TRINITY_DN28282_c1_g1_i1:225-1538(+)